MNARALIRVTAVGTAALIALQRVRLDAARRPPASQQYARAAALAARARLPPDRRGHEGALRHRRRTTTTSCRPGARASGCFTRCATVPRSSRAKVGPARRAARAANAHARERAPDRALQARARGLAQLASVPAGARDELDAYRQRRTAPTAPMHRARPGSRARRAAAADLAGRTVVARIDRALAALDARGAGAASAAARSSRCVLGARAHRARAHRRS